MAVTSCDAAWLQIFQVRTSPWPGSGKGRDTNEQAEHERSAKALGSMPTVASGWGE